MSDLIGLPQVDEMAMQAIAQNSAGIQAVAEQVLALAGAAAKAVTTARQAVSLATETKAEVADIKGELNDINRKLRERITLDQNQIGTLYQAVHDRAAWAAKHHPDTPYGTHIQTIWRKIKRDLVVNKYQFILDKDYNYAMSAVMAYPGFGRNWEARQSAA